MKMRPPSSLPALFFRLCIPIGFLFMAPHAGSAGEIYFYIDEQGVHHYSDAPTSSKYVPSSLDFPEPAGNLSIAAYDSIIREAAQSNEVECALVKAVIKAESAFNPEAVSTAGARGLMQIMPANFDTFGLGDPFNPEENIHAGTRYLKQLITRYDGDLHLALAAYNAGPKAVDQYSGIPPYEETRNYVDRVLAYYDRYSRKEHP
ncbi:MAG: transglycosylase SLT domain-containing protein [Thermodesulfobacteriota bacterium]